MSKIFSFLAGLILYVIYIGGIILYFYTTYITFITYGFLWGFAAFCLPIISTIVLLILSIISAGILNTFSILVFYFIGAIILGLIFLFLSNLFEKFENKSKKIQCPHCNTYNKLEKEYCYMCGKELKEKIL